MLAIYLFGFGGVRAGLGPGFAFGRSGIVFCASVCFCLGWVGLGWVMDGRQGTCVSLVRGVGRLLRRPRLAGVHGAWGRVMEGLGWVHTCASVSRSLGEILGWAWKGVLAGGGKGREGMGDEGGLCVNLPGGLFRYREVCARLFTMGSLCYRLA